MFAPFCFEYRRITAGSRKYGPDTSPPETQLLSRTSRGATSSMKTALAELRGRGRGWRLTQPRTGAAARIARARDRDTCCMRATLRAKAEHRQTAHDVLPFLLPSSLPPSLSLCIVLAGEMQPPSERNSCQLRSSPRAELNNPSATYYARVRSP